MKKRIIKQGEVYMCDLSLGSKEHEQSGVRPVIVVSANVRNETSHNVFIFPLTHAKKKEQPCHYKLYKKDYPFFSYKEQTVICEEGRSISKTRLERLIGTVLSKDIQEILKCKEYVFKEKENQ